MLQQNSFSLMVVPVINYNFLFNNVQLRSLNIQLIYTYSLTWHKVLNAVVAELNIHKFMHITYLWPRLLVDKQIELDCNFQFTNDYVTLNLLRVLANFSINFLTNIMECFVYVVDKQDRILSLGKSSHHYIYIEISCHNI